MEEKDRTPASSAPRQAPVALPAPARVTPPVPLLTEMVYPEDARGEASVELLLTLNAEGAVTEAEVASGEAPFGAHAARAARSWKFTPAERDGRPVASKIRYVARFVPPLPVATERSAESQAERSAESQAEHGVESQVERSAKSQTERGVESHVERAAEMAGPEIVVVGDREPIRHRLGRTEISRLPGAFDDAFRAIEALPGVTPVASGLPYFYVRGAPPGNVGYFFDGIPVPYLYHFAAGPSVFHPAFVERVDLYPGAYPARYGRYAGAIVAGELGEPSYRTRGEWKVRLVDSGAMLEMPFAGGRGTAMAAGRFSYTGVVLSIISPNVFLTYGDYQGRVRYDLTQQDTIELLAFGAQDYATQTEAFEVEGEDGLWRREKKTKTAIDVGFHRLDLRWNRRLRDGTWRTALLVGRDATGLADGRVDVHTHLVGARTELRQQLREDLRINAGADVLGESLRQDFRDDRTSRDDGIVPGLGESVTADDLADQGFEERKRLDISTGAFVDLGWDVTPALRVTPGVRADILLSGERSALAVDPRVTAEYRFGEKVKVAHGLAWVHQGPSFVGAVPGLKPSLAGGLQGAVQHSSSLSCELPAGFSSTVSVFQSAFSDMTDLLSLTRLEQGKANAPPARAGDPEQRSTDERTDGGAQGVELMLRRSLARRVGGFVSYTLSRSWRSSGRASGPAGSDRRHVLNLAGSVDLGRDWRAGARGTFYTGVPAEVAYASVARRPPRTSPFWRLDFKLEKRWYLERPRLWWGLSLEVLNTTLNRETLQSSCNAHSCVSDELGPITLPSLAVEGAF